jgi:hypothetical protein
MRTTIRAAVVAAALLLATTAGAQEQPVISRAAPDPARWDVAVHAAWFGSNKPDIANDWDRWYSAGAGTVSIGRYWTPHLKLDLRGMVSGAGQIYTQDPVIPFEPRVHHFRAMTLQAGVAYQFFENQWFHPFVAGGLEVVQERHRIDIPQHYVPNRIPVPQIVPASRGVEGVSYAARPFIGAGFKWFVSDRAFIRTDLATSLSSRGFAQTVWSGGVGVEF